MLKIYLQKAIWPAFQKLPRGLRQAAPPPVTAQRLPGTGRHVPSCWMGTHGRNEPWEPLNSPKRAKEFIYRLHPKERSCLLNELQSFESIAIAQVLFHNAIPFVGFGFLDNAIMIAAGTQIELSIGVTLGISTMACYVEALASKLGMQVPDLTPKQVDMWQTRLSSHMGKAIGVSIGCILGMFPLFFLSDDDEDKESPPGRDAHS
ncbi:transmembrane protein 65-like [Oryzias latipes]|uniref:transmembrane protein 65-like n=1 Tax=Oryzias latipes TaxID=8090 RepID=UPI000CE173D1|nr:transmembrane protein 65-like [Oryzias latipes]